MDERSMYEEILQKSLVILMNHVDPVLLMDLLRAQGILLRTDEEDILSSRKETEQARLLLDVVQRKGAKEMKDFLHLLHDVTPDSYALIQRDVLHEYPSADLPRGKLSSSSVSEDIFHLSQCLMRRAVGISTRCWA